MSVMWRRVVTRLHIQTIAAQGETSPTRFTHQIFFSPDRFELVNNRFLFFHARYDNRDFLCTEVKSGCGINNIDIGVEDACRFGCRNAVILRDDAEIELRARFGA